MAEASRLKMIQVHKEKLKAKHQYQNWCMTAEEKIIKQKQKMASKLAIEEQL